MIAILRNWARRWATEWVAKQNDDLRRELLRAQAKADRLAQSLEHLRRINLANFGARCKAEVELEQARVAASGKGDGWADVVDAGLGEPDRGQP